MRHGKTQSGRPYVRSEPNGPVEFKLHPTAEMYSGKRLSLPYKAAKPYTWAGYSPLESFDSSTAQELGIIMPPLKSVVASAFKSEPTVSSNIFADVIDDRYAVNRALENAQAYGQLLMLVTAAEAKDTVMMIRKVFIRLYEVAMAFYKHIRKLNIVGTLEEVSALWLEFRYGWRPLALEAKAVYEQLQRVSNGGVLSSYGSDKQKANPDAIKDFESEVEYLGDTYTFKHTFVPKGDVVTKCGFNYVNKQGSRNEDFKAIWGLDWQSLASTVWELIPFSVFIDMFFNIGNLLQARDVHDQVDSFNYWQTFVGEFELTSRLVKVGKSPYVTLRSVMTLEEELALVFHPLHQIVYQMMESEVERLRRLPGAFVGWTSTWWDTREQAQESAVHYGNKCRRWLDSYIDEDRCDAFPKLGYSFEDYKGGSNQFYFDTILISKLDPHGTGYYNGEYIPSLVDKPICTVDGAELNVTESVRLCKDIFYRWLRANAKITTGSFKSKNTKLNGDPLFESFGRLFLTGNGKEERIPTDEQMELLKYTNNLSVVQRVLRDEFSHSSTFDFDLATGQWADLAALAMQLFSSYRKKH